MKKTVLSLCFLLGFLVSFGQPNPVKWSAKVEQKTRSEADIIITAIMPGDWHIYVQKPYDTGPIPTTIEFEKNSGYQTVGATRELSTPHVDEMWVKEGVPDPIAFNGKAVFKQKIKILSDKKTEIKIHINHGTCNKTECLSPNDVDLTAVLNADLSAITNEETKNTNKDSVAAEVVTVRGMSPVSFRFLPRKYSEQEYELVIRSVVDTGWVMASVADNKFPLKFNFVLPQGVKLKGDLVSAQTNISSKIFGNAYQFANNFRQRFWVESGDSLLMKNIQVKVDLTATNGKEVYRSEDASQTIDMSGAMLESQDDLSVSYLWTFIIAFLSGFAALLTPCVFPMIPMTVSFFLKRSKDRKKGIKNAMTYGLFIIVIYVTLGLVVTSIFGVGALNALSTNVWFNLFFFIMLVFFAASFLGGFEIVLPSKWVNAADRGADKGGLIGIFFMAFTLALVSFSCTGPIVGSILVQAALKGGMGPFWGMLGFSMAIALPFTLFAIFPSWLNSMPSSGGWLNSVKVSLGFLELALALKFLSNADLVVKAHLLEREMFIALWVVIFALWGFYLLGKIKLSHDSDLPYVSVGRLSLSILTFTFVMYLMPGMWGAPLKWINAFLPPSTYAESPCGVGNLCPESDGLPEHAEFGPNQIPVFHDYKYALEYAREVKKPLMIDFTGYACVNCRQMENTVWVDEKIRKILSNDVVVVSLYVDDKTSLPENEQYTSKYSGKEIRSVGKKWSEFEFYEFKSQSQPLYFLLDNYETVLNGKANFQDHGKVDLFEKWLKEGIKQFELFNGSKELRPVLVAVQ